MDPWEWTGSAKIFVSRADAQQRAHPVEEALHNHTDIRDQMMRADDMTLEAFVSDQLVTSEQVDPRSSPQASLACLLYHSLNTFSDM